MDRTVESFSLMKTGIRPEWEDHANKNGGELYCLKPMDPAQLDVYWEALTLGCIGEILDGANEICGCRVVDKSKQGRAKYRLEIWLRRDDQDIAEDVRRMVMNTLQECNKGRASSVPNFDYRDHKGY